MRSIFVSVGPTSNRAASNTCNSWFYDASQCPEAVDLYNKILEAGLTKVVGTLHPGQQEKQF